MLTSATKKRIAFAVATTALMGAAVLGDSAGADPKQFNAFVGVGSDTTQDVTNALAGFTNNVNFAPVQSSVASGSRQIISFDALNPSNPNDPCITTKLGAPSFTRPNGSTQGRRALSRALDGTGYGTAACAGPTDVSGLVDFARSSAGPAAGDTGTTLTYIPFGRDALSFAYYRANGAPVTTLTRAQLTSLFTTGPQVINGVRIVPCGIQNGSGTFQFWNTVTTASTGAEGTATAECNALIPNAATGGRAQENSGDDLKARGDALAAVTATANNQVVIGFSAANFIAKSNGVSPGTIPAGVAMGSIDFGAAPGIGGTTGIVNPVSGVSPNVIPVDPFYQNTIFGRDVFTVWPTAVVTSAFGNTDAKTLVVGSTSSMCAAITTLRQFGFEANANCGSVAVKGSAITGQL
jgi:hypothetical protein